MPIILILKQLTGLLRVLISSQLMLHHISGKKLRIRRLLNSFRMSKSMVTQIAEKYLFAAIKAFDIYRKIEKAKGKDNFVTEISMDEVPDPQTPVELFFILMMLAAENIP